MTAEQRGFRMGQRTTLTFGLKMLLYQSGQLKEEGEKRKKGKLHV